MPELPEVETVRKGLESKIVGKKITVVEIKNKKTVKNKTALFVETLKNNKSEYSFLFRLLHDFNEKTEEL